MCWIKSLFFHQPVPTSLPKGHVVGVFCPVFTFHKLLNKMRGSPTLWVRTIHHIGALTNLLCSFIENGLVAGVRYVHHFIRSWKHNRRHWQRQGTHHNQFAKVCENLFWTKQRTTIVRFGSATHTVVKLANRVVPWIGSNGKHTRSPLGQVLARVDKM